MTEFEQRSAKKEIHETLRVCHYCFNPIGISLIDEPSKNFRGRLKTYLQLFITFLWLDCMVLGQYSYVMHQMRTCSNAIEGLIGSNLHLAGYGLMSQAKLLTIWYKQDKLRRLVKELSNIWPVDVKDEKEAAIKRESLSSLRNRQLLYSFWNIFGNILYSLTPIAVLLYLKARGMSAELGYVYLMWYPFDKSKPVYHEVVYCFEMAGGVLAVFALLGTDLLFMTMTSHMCMLLRLLQSKIRNLIDDEDIKRDTGTLDCYQNIVDAVKIHQRIIEYTNDLEGAFAASNLVNVILSSINICSCAFNVVFLDTLMEMSNKFFIGAALTQMGIVCWYADEIYRVSLGVSDAVYESGWYRADPRSRRALLLMLKRSQKPLYFTALKFSNITMTTFSSVSVWSQMEHAFPKGTYLPWILRLQDCTLTGKQTQEALSAHWQHIMRILMTAYSYFTLLYASFKQI